MAGVVGNQEGKCQVCEKPSTFRCSWCRLVFYCSKEHQKENWTTHKPNCTKPKFKVNEGRHLVTTETCKPDTVLFKDRPLVLGPKVGVSSSENEEGGGIFCLGCFKEIPEGEEEEVQCPLCTLPVCSALCAQQHFHADFECRFFREGKQRVLDGVVSPNGLAEPNAHLSNTVCVLQTLLYFRCLLLKIYFPERWTEINSMESNNQHRSGIQHLEQTTRIFEDFKKVFCGFGMTDSLSKPDLHRLVGIVSTNGMEIQAWTNFELLAIFPQLSLLEHSCCPNTRVYVVPRPAKDYAYELFVRTSVQVQKGARLSTTYTNLLWNTEKRREDLRRTRFFWCECPRCLDPTELGTHLSTILCPVPECKAFAVPRPKTSLTTNSTDMFWQCTNTNCAKTCEAWQVKKVDSRLAELVAGLRSSVGKYKEMQSKMAEVVHPNYYLTFVVNHSLVQMLGQDSRSRNSKQVVEEKLELCNRMLGTIKTLDPGLASLHAYTAVLYYEMQSAILALCGAEGDDDFGILRANVESVQLAKMYLTKCIACFDYEFLDRPESKLKLLAAKKMDYLNMVLKNPTK